MAGFFPAYAAASTKHSFSSKSTSLCSVYLNPGRQKLVGDTITGLSIY
jgi:hypothetical protein